MSIYCTLTHAVTSVSHQASEHIELRPPVGYVPAYLPPVTRCHLTTANGFHSCGKHCKGRFLWGKKPQKGSKGKVKTETCKLHKFGVFAMNEPGDGFPVLLIRVVILHIFSCSLWKSVTVRSILQGSHKASIGCFLWYCKSTSAYLKGIHR